MLVDVREQHQAVLKRRQHGHAEALDIGPLGAGDGVVNCLVKEVRLPLVGACAEVTVQLDLGAVCLLKPCMARVDLKFDIVFPAQVLQKRKCPVEVVGRHDKVDVAHAAAFRLRVVCRGRRALQHGDGDVCLAKLGEHAVLRLHKAIPAPQVLPGKEKVFRQVGGGKLETLDNVYRIADDRLRHQLGAHGRPQVIGERKAGRGCGSRVARIVRQGAFCGDYLDRILFGGGKVHGCFLSLLRLGMLARAWKLLARLTAGHARGLCVYNKTTAITRRKMPKHDAIQVFCAPAVAFRAHHRLPKELGLCSALS